MMLIFQVLKSALLVCLSISNLCNAIVVYKFGTFWQLLNHAMYMLNR